MKTLLKSLAAAAVLLSLFTTVSCKKDTLDPYTRRYVVRENLGFPNRVWTDFNLCDTNFCTISTEEYGDYFAWGEFRKKDAYTWENYKYGTTVYDKQLYRNKREVTKYNPLITARDTTLFDGDDCAFMHLGAPWHMPSWYHARELILNTKSEWYDDYMGTGIAGRLFTSTCAEPEYNLDYTDQKFFLPACGYYEGTTKKDENTAGWYWTSNENRQDPVNAYALYFDRAEVKILSVLRSNGLSVRPTAINGRGAVGIPNKPNIGDHLTSTYIRETEKL